jgi:hypothetical protein
VAKVYDRLDDRLRTWIEQQPVLFVGTAPLAADGHVNVSPKGMAGTFAVLDERTVAYLDYVGSGTETIAHVRENGRLVLMWCAFEGPPRIVRLHGRARIVLPGTADFDDLRGVFAKEREVGQRAVVVLEATRISDACGYAVPEMRLVGDRDVLDRHQGRRDEAYFDRYRRERNAVSIDGLPGVPSPTPGPEPDADLG